MDQPVLSLHYINKDKGADRAANQRLCFQFHPEISSLVTLPNVCRTWSETPKTGVLVMRLVLLYLFCFFVFFLFIDLRTDGWVADLQPR